MAIEIGMPLNDFWSNAESLFDVYAKAYNNRMDREAWLQGVYVTKALEAAINNVMPSSIAFGLGLTKEKFKPIQYPSNPMSYGESDVNQDFSKELSQREMRERDAMVLDMFP